MKNGVGLVFADGTLQDVAITNIATHHIHVVDDLGTDQFATGHPVADEADHACPRVHQAAGQPTAHQAGGAGDQHGAVLPKTARQAHTLHGAAPLSHSSLRC